MNNKFFNKRIPVILGIGLMTLAITLTTIAVRIQTDLKSKASNSEMPQNVKVTNLSDDSFTITYQTDAPVTGSVNFGKDRKLGNIELEDLDKEKGSFTPHNIHSITVKKLAPATAYQLVIVSGQNTFLNNEVPFRIETGPSISSPSAMQLKVKGKVVLPDGNPPIETIIYLSSDDSQLLSTVVGKNGEFNFSLKDLRSKDLNSYFTAYENTSFKLEAVSKSLKSIVSISLSDADSIPTITLSNDYDFTYELTPVASKSADAEFVNFPIITTQPESSKPQILTPKKDQSFTDPKPQFRGTSLPNETVEIIIHSDENTQIQVKADSNGNWAYRPPNPLSPGQHTITIKTRDSSGTLTTLVRSFTVFADSQVSESVTPTTTPTQKIIPTSTPIPTNTSIPTLAIPIPTVAVTAFPSPTSTIETKGGLPPTGNSSILLIAGGIVAAISGIALFLLTRIVP